MTLFVPDITGSRANHHSKGRRRTPQNNATSHLWNLDDTRPAGPYRKPLDQDGLRLICLATIRQAILDERSSRHEDEVLRARQFLAGTARDWLRAMQIFRNNCEERIYDLIYHGNYEQLLLLMEDPGDEKDTAGACYHEDRRHEDD